jgi:hypothetical protein
LFSTDNIDATTCVWKFNVKGLEETVPCDVVSILNGPVISVIGDYDGCISADVSQYGPQLTPSMGTTTGLAVAALNQNKVVRAGASMYYSTNMGTSWTKCTMNGSQGYVSLSTDGNILLHSPGGLSATYRSLNNGSSWTTVNGLGWTDARTVADAVNSNKFYAYNPNSGAVMVSTNGGVSFLLASNIGAYGSKHIRTVPGYEGHVWVALYGGGLTRSINSGQSFSKISNVSSCDAVGIGKAGPGLIYPTIYIWGTVGGVQGLYRSTNQGSSWTRINDDAHEWGGPANGQFVIGDMNIYGRAYMSTAGRGIAYVQIQDCNGDWGGSAFIDSCATCVNGNTGKKACIKDCKGDWGGLDTSTCSKDCNGIWGGLAYKDSCATCVGGNTGKQACIKDCTGLWGGKAYLDSCATCVGGTTGKSACLKDCNGIWGGTAIKDNCAICVGGNTGKQACIKDCKGVWGGKAYLDSCATCVGGTTGKKACTTDCNGIWGGKAFLDSCATCIDTTQGQKVCATSIATYTTEAFSYVPNPFSQSLQLKLITPSEYNIVTIHGEVIEEGHCENSCLIGTNIHPGFYLLTIRNKTEQKTVKIIKQ